MDLWMVKQETNGFPNLDTMMKRGVMFKSDLLALTQIQIYIYFPIFPPPFLATTSLFLRSLEEDNICLKCNLILHMSPLEYF